MREPQTPHDAALVPGRRVRVPSRGAAHVLTNRVGTIVAPDPLNEGYYIVHLDEPGTYYLANGETEPLPDVTEADDNLELLPA